MLFNSYIFIFLFFPLVLIGYYGLNYAKLNSLAMCYLVGMSLWFYGYFNIYYLWILIGSVIVNYLLSLVLHKSNDKTVRLVVMWLGVLFNISILFIFKYHDFFATNINNVFHTRLALLDIKLPLGISFYTFQQLSYIIDCYKRECEEYSFIEYSTYVTFFPQLIAGPIVYHSELIPQFRNEKNQRINYENMSKGIYAFSLGLAKKVLVADTLSKVIDQGYAWGVNLNSPTVMILMVSYSLQIYFDFSGYCDMAYGIGYMFNIKLPINFNSPYKADSIGDFWDRWHMTLTRFFTKYIYIPLGGSRKGTLRTYINIMIVFLVSGLWHGASWNFVVWGGINGIGIIIDKIIGKYFKKLPKLIRMSMTFIFASFAWSIFKFKMVSTATDKWKLLFTGGIGHIDQLVNDKFNNIFECKVISRLVGDTILMKYPWILLVLFVVICVVVCMTMKNTQEKVEELQLTKRKYITTLILLVWSIVSLSQVSEFLYFNF